MNIPVSSSESPTETIAIQHARDVDSAARAWLQRIFGRALRDDEDVTIVLSAPRAAPSAAVRKAASRRLKAVLDQAAANMQEISQVEFDAAVDEAMKHVRPTFQP